MTIEEKLKEMLVDNGMFDEHAKEVIARIKSAKENEAMSERWGRDMDGYPKPLLAVLWMSAKRHALAWIDENVPMAWYRPMFVD